MSLSTAIWNFSIGVNVINSGSPSRIRIVRRISFEMTTRPKSSILRTIPVAFISWNSFVSKLFYAIFCTKKENIPIFFAIISGEKMPHFTKKLQFSVKNSQWQIAQEKNLKSVYTALRTVYFVKRTKQIVVSQNFNNIYKHLFKTRFLRPFLVFYPLLFDILNKVLNIFKHFRNILFVYF